MTKKEKAKKIFEDNGIFLSNEELANLGTAISDVLMMIAEDITEKEPYATITINNYKQTSMCVDTALDEEE